jgi:PAS domain S-box-containing protein
MTRAIFRNESCVDAEKVEILVVASQSEDVPRFERLAGLLRFCWTPVKDVDEAGPVLATLLPDVIVLSLPEAPAAALLAALHEAAPGVPIIVIAESYDEQTALDSMEAGVWQYLCAPVLDRYSLTNALVQAALFRKANAAQETTSARLDARNARLRRIIEQEVHAVLVVGEDKHIVYANPYAEKLLNRTARQLVGLKFDFPLHVRGFTEIDIEPLLSEPFVCEMRVVEIDWDGEPAHLVFIRDVMERKEAEGTLKRVVLENSRLAAAIQNLSNGVVITLPNPPNNPIIFVNRGFTAITGYTPEEVIGLTSGFLQGPDTDPETVKEIGRAMQEGRPFAGVILNYRKDGTPFWNELRIDAVYDDDGTLISYVGLQNDVTARKLAEEELRQYTERMKMLHTVDRAILSAQSLDAIARAVLNHIRKLIPFYCAGVAITDSNTHEFVILARHWEGHSQIAAGTRIPYSQLDSDGELRHGHIVEWPTMEDFAHDSPIGQTLYDEGLRSLIAIPLVAQGEMMGLFTLGGDQPGRFSDDQIAIAREVANPLAVAIWQAHLYRQVQDYAAHLEHRVAERTAELRESEERAAAILRNTSDSIILARSDGTIEQVNPAFNSLFGYKGKEALGTHLPELTQPVYRPLIEAALGQIAEGSLYQRLEVISVRKDQSVFTADVALVPVREQQSEQHLIVCSIRDITERKQMEENLRAALRKERELNELKTRFASMVSHEFRLPLATILSSSDILTRYHEQLSDERRVEHLETIQEQVSSLTEMLDDILVISRAQTVALPFVPSRFQVEKFLREIIDDVRAATNGSHKIIFSSAGDCQEVMMDRKLIRQLVMNLLSNAVKYSSQGGMIYVDLYCDLRQTAIQVKDSGIGIPEDDQKHLFEIFHRSANVGATPGSGLGLAIAKQAVDLHNGEILFESLVGVGTTVTVHLPTYPTE